MFDILNGKDIKKLSVGELSALCEKLREQIISTVTHNGGHLSSNLGVIELTVALHYVFNLPKDKLIFDVGHQCYAHKLLSKREQSFDTLRKRGGVAGFPKREESEYDCYNTGHAGTSVSAALGMAKARDIKQEDYNVIALIGDGSFNNGLIYEAFNSLRPLRTNILVILNDNGMSISPTVGSIHEYLEVLSESYEHKKKIEKHANIFERFGFVYDGVYDGNNLTEMIDKLKEVKELLKTRSVILHVVTKKGKGYRFCEENPQSTHGVSGEEKSEFKSYAEIFGDTMCEIAEQNKNVVAVTAAMTPNLGLSRFFEQYPDRSIDVGICEEHATVLCASLASCGLKPYYAVYSTFLQRSIDEIVLDICSQNLPVTFCIDHAGISGEDGETHQGVFDITLLSGIPDITIAAPKDLQEFKAMLNASVNFDKPLAIRYPRESVTVWESDYSDFHFGTWEFLHSGTANIAVLACGERMLRIAFAVLGRANKEGVDFSVVNARSVKPVDADFLNNLRADTIITLEDNQLIGGFGSMICSYFSQNKAVKVKCFAYDDKFIPHGSVKELMEEFGINEEKILEYVLRNAIR